MISIEKFKNKIKEQEIEKKCSIIGMHNFFYYFFNHLFTQCKEYFIVSSEYLLKNNIKYDLIINIDKRVSLKISIYKINNKLICDADLKFMNKKISATYEYDDGIMIFVSESYFNNHKIYQLGDILRNSILVKDDSKIFEKIIKELYEKL